MLQQAVSVDASQWSPYKNGIADFCDVAPGRSEREDGEVRSPRKDMGCSTRDHQTSDGLIFHIISYIYIIYIYIYT